MTDDEIIKALKYCSTDVRENTCPKCAFYKKNRCSTLMLNGVSDLINRQKAEIERLKHRKTELQIRNQELQHEKSEAIKAFAERLKEKAMQKFDWNEYVEVEDINNLVKEMTEE